MEPDVTIEEVLDAFIAEQRHRVSARTMRSYDDVVDLLRHSLNGYGPNTLDKTDHKRWEKAFADDEEAFCHLFGPEHILSHLSEFLGYFMVRKVWASQELLRSAGTVTKRLARWLYEQGYVSDEDRDIAAEQGSEAARDLLRAERLASLLYNQSQTTPSFDPDDLGPRDLVEDYLVIDRIELGSLYFAGGIGPVAVSEKASALAEVGWGVNITLERLEGPGGSSRSATSTPCSSPRLHPSHTDLPVDSRPRRGARPDLGVIGRPPGALVISRRTVRDHLLSDGFTDCLRLKIVHGGWVGGDSSRLGANRALAGRRA